MKRLNESRIEFDLNYTHVVLDFAFLSRLEIPL
jgi:hypothetical protein